jgi:hypothetical protein
MSGIYDYDTGMYSGQTLAGDAYAQSSDELMEDLYGQLGERALKHLGFAHSGWGDYHHQHDPFALQDFQEQYGFMFPEYSDQEEKMVEKRYDTKRDQAREAMALWQDQTFAMKALQQEMLEDKVEMKTGHVNRLTDIELATHKHQQNLLLDKMQEKRDSTMNQIARTGIRSGDLKQVKKNTMNEISNRIHASNMTRKNIQDTERQSIDDLIRTRDQSIDMADTKYEAQLNIKDTDFTNALEMMQLDEVDAIDKIRDDYQMRILAGMKKVFQNIPGLPPEPEFVEPETGTELGDLAEDVATNDEQGIGEWVVCNIVPPMFRPSSCN